MNCHRHNPKSMSEHSILYCYREHELIALHHQVQMTARCRDIQIVDWINFVLFRDFVA